MSEGLKDNAHVSDYYVVYGDTSLEYALELISRETKSRSLTGLITALRKGFYVNDPEMKIQKSEQ